MSSMSMYWLQIILDEIWAILELWDLEFGEQQNGDMQSQDLGA